MSVTFSCPNAPMTDVSEACNTLDCVFGNRCPYCDDGVVKYRTSSAPSCNFANGNAAAILKLVGLKVDSWGDIDVSVVPMVRTTILGLLNSERSRRHLVREPQTSQAPGHAKLIDFGNGDDQTMRRLMDLDALLAYAEEHGYTVSWG